MLLHYVPYAFEELRKDGRYFSSFLLTDLSASIRKLMSECQPVLLDQCLKTKNRCDRIVDAPALEQQYCNPPPPPPPTNVDDLPETP